MLATSHFGYDSLMQELALLPAERTGGVAPLRHQVALLQYRAKQRSYQEQGHAAVDARDRSLSRIATTSDCKPLVAHDESEIITHTPVSPW